MVPAGALGQPLSSGSSAGVLAGGLQFSSRLPMGLLTTPHGEVAGFQEGIVFQLSRKTDPTASASQASACIVLTADPSAGASDVAELLDHTGGSTSQGQILGYVVPEGRGMVSTKV